MPSQYEKKMPGWINNPQARLERKNAFDASLVFGSSRFNKETGRLTAPSSQPFLWAIDQDSGLIKADLSQPRNCPVCDGAAGECLFIKDGFRHSVCSVCDMIFVDHVLKDDVLEQYWQEEKVWTAVLNSAPQMEIDRLKFRYGLDLVEYRLKGRNLLDIGAGNGTFVRLAHQSGWKAAAMELNRESGNKLLKEGFQVIGKELHKAVLPSAAYDLISFWEVLEHISEPRFLLAEARRLLNKDGLLLIMVPNAGSLVTRLLHEKSNTFGGHSHVNHFNARNMSALMAKSGFKVLEMETVITELGAINNYLSFQNPYSGSGETVVKEITPAFIHDNMLGSRLLVLAARED